MATLSLRINDDDAELLKKYAQFYGQSITDFIKQSVFERIEDEHDLEDLRAAIVENTGKGITLKEAARELNFES